MTRRLLIAVAALTAALVAALPAQTATPTLVGTVGPGFTITLTKAGKKVTTLKAGKYIFKIVDKATSHNFHLTGPGQNKKFAAAGKESVGWTGTVSVTVTLKKGTYKFVCDPHATSMKGSFTVT
jgi:plastocyanin